MLPHKSGWGWNPPTPPPEIDAYLGERAELQKNELREGKKLKKT